jgi:ABC-type lipoprotein release transport system permease subunit
VDTEFARKFFPNEDAIGKRVNLMANPLAGQAEIVGVVGHVNQWGLDSDRANPLRAQIYLSFWQMRDDQFSGPTGASVVVGFTGAAFAVTTSIRHAIHEMNAEEVAYGFRTMDQIISSSLAARRFSMFLLGTFAALALLLASVGIYGVMSYLAGRRTHEIGIRIALGARQGSILLLVIGQGAQMALIGVASGITAAFGLTRLMAKYSLLFGVSATDPLTFGGVAILLMIIAVAACYIPARRATKVDPMVALRYE